MTPDPIVERLKEAGVPIIEYTPEIQKALNAADSGSAIKNLLDMKGFEDVPAFDYERKDSAHAVMTFPGSRVSILYKPSLGEFEIRVTDKNGDPLPDLDLTKKKVGEDETPTQNSQEAFLAHLGSSRHTDYEGVSHMEITELAESIEMIANLKLNRGREDFGIK